MPHVVAGVLRDGNGDRILACRRRADGPFPLRWEFPGGKVEPGETPVEALRRELREELDIEARIGRRLTEVTHRYPEQKEAVHLTFFEVDGYEGRLRNRAFSNITWATPAELRQLDFLEADLPLVEALASEGTP